VLEETPVVLEPSDIPVTSPQFLWKWNDTAQEFTTLSPTNSDTLFLEFSEEIIAISKENGKLLWKFQGDFVDIYSSNVYAVSESYIHCLAMATGQKKWKSKIGFDPHFDLFPSGIFVRSKMEDTDSSSFLLTALSFNEDKILWTTSLNTQPLMTKNIGTHLSLLYLKAISTLDLSSGVVKWTHQTQSPLFPEPVLQQGNAPYPSLYIASGNPEGIFSENIPQSSLSKIDTSNGSVVWSLSTQGQPMLLYFEQGIGTFITWGQLNSDNPEKKSWKEKSHFNTFDTATGKILSDIDLETFCGTHTFKNGILYAALFPTPPFSTFGKTSALNILPATFTNIEIKAFDIAQGIIAWRALPQQTSSVKKLHQEQDVLIVEFESGDLFAYDAKIGKSLWKAQYDLNALFDLIFFQEAILLPSQEGDVLCIHLKTGELLWRSTLYPYKKMILLNGILYLISLGQQGPDGSWQDISSVHAINPQNGKILWSQQMEGEINDIQHDKTHLWVATKTNNGYTLYCFNAEKEKALNSPSEPSVTVSLDHIS
jgi:outer membrane protein assembly factor BamB